MDPVEHARRLLTEALGRLQDSPRLPSYDAVLADARAAATAEVLRAQQLAADAVRTREGLERQLEQERAAWLVTRQAYDDNAGRLVQHVAQIEGALEGARTALEAELLAHHDHAQELEAVVATERSLRLAESSAHEAELGECQRLVSESRAMAAAAEARCRELHAGLTTLQGEHALLSERAAASEHREGLAVRQAQEAEHRASAADARADDLVELMERLSAERDDARSVGRSPRHRSSLVANAPNSSGRRTAKRGVRQRPGRTSTR